MSVNMFKRSFYNTLVKQSKYHLLAVRLLQKPSKKTREKEPKLANEVVNYLSSSPEYNEIKDKLPNYLLRKYKSPESMYLINKKTAQDITKTLKNYMDDDSPVIEVNPGLGILSKELLRCQKNRIYMYETSSTFTPYLNELVNEYPDRIVLKIADFFGMWKLAFRDKMDGGSRIQELLGYLYTDENERVVKIIGSMPGLSFVKHMIYNLVFHNTTGQLGKPDLFITMPAYHYQFLTDSEVQLSKQKAIPTLFQLLFNCKVLTTVPKVHFLPWAHLPNNKRVTVTDEHSLYLVNITQKDKLPCPPEYLPLLWYFFKPQMFSKTTRVIPLLEQWIPGCGIWLITGQDPPDTNALLAPTEEDHKLPHMTIFTEFGDLNLSQKVTIFKRFISWPEFEQCQFRVTMENNLPKFATELDSDDKDTVTHIDDDIDHSDSEHEEA